MSEGGREGETEREGSLGVETCGYECVLVCLCLCAHVQNRILSKEADLNRRPGPPGIYLVWP